MATRKKTTRMPAAGAASSPRWWSELMTAQPMQDVLGPPKPKAKKRAKKK